MNDKLNFERAIQGLLIALVAAGVAGLWTMTTNVARVEERLSNYIDIQRDTNQTINRRLDQIDQRLRLIETKQAQQRNTAPPSP